MAKLFATVVVFLVSFVSVMLIRDESPQIHDGLIVKTSNGLIKGKLMKTFNKNEHYLAFFKVPFAKAPSGHRRFQAPEPSDQWNGVYDSTKEGEICVQYAPNETIIGSEDCLFLRIYTPKYHSENGQLFPVMYYIHGGAFVEGSPNFNDYGPDLFMEKGVVLALVQYRLGIYGFLSTEDMICPGNNGLKDQRLGLKWIKENAKAFGGDPNHITIVGHSAGAVCTGYLVNSPTTTGLFRAAIQQSASEIMSLVRPIHPKRKAFMVAQKFGISTTNSKELIEQLKKVDYKKLHEAASSVGGELTHGGLPTVTFAPVIEPDHSEAIITQKPLQQLQNGDYNRVPIMLGFTSLEATTLMNLVEAVKSQLKTDTSILVPNTIVPINNTTKMSIAQQINEYYFGNNSVDYGVLRYASDNAIVRCVHEKSEIIAKWSATYLYKFSYLGILGDPSHPNRRGVGHAEELWYMFHKADEPNNVPKSDTRIRHQLVTMWTDFAKTLNPTRTERALLDSVHWPLLNEKTEYQSLSIDDKLTIKKRVNETDLKFWRKMFSYDRSHSGWY